MRPHQILTASPGPIMPSCTLARGREETLLFGRDATTRIAPPPIPRIVAPERVSRP